MATNIPSPAGFATPHRRDPIQPRHHDPRIGSFGRPLLARSIELVRQIPAQAGRASDDPERLSLLLWSGLHGVVSLRINKPTLDWPPAAELAEQITRAIIQPKVRKPKA